MCPCTPICVVIGISMVVSTPSALSTQRTKRGTFCMSPIRLISPTPCATLSRSEKHVSPAEGHMYIDVCVANANLLASYTALLSTIVALDNTASMLVVMDELALLNNLDLLVATATNSENNRQP